MNPKMQEEFKKKYNKVENLPSHVFLDMELSHPVGDEFREYLTFLFNNSQESLRYIHRKGQEYKDYGGANPINFSKWLSQLKTHLNIKG